MCVLYMMLLAMHIYDKVQGLRNSNTDIWARARAEKWQYCVLTRKWWQPKETESQFTNNAFSCMRLGHRYCDKIATVAHGIIIVYTHFPKQS